MCVQKLASHFLWLSCMTVSSIRLISKCLGTVSKALLMFVTGNMLRGAGFLPLKSSSICCVMFVRSAVEYEVWTKAVLGIIQVMCLFILFRTSL